MSDRINLGKLKEIIPPLDLLGLQLNSYKEFLQRFVLRITITSIAWSMFRTDGAMLRAIIAIVFATGPRMARLCI